MSKQEKNSSLISWSWKQKHNFSFSIVPEDVEDLISSMKTNKASGPNNIPTNILKLFKKEFSKSLSDMINMSFNQGVFPNILKIANVIPIHKKGDKLDCNN